MQDVVLGSFARHIQRKLAHGKSPRFPFESAEGRRACQRRATLVAPVLACCSGLDHCCGAAPHASAPSTSKSSEMPGMYTSCAAATTYRTDFNICHPFIILVTCLTIGATRRRDAGLPKDDLGQADLWCSGGITPGRRRPREFWAAPLACSRRARKCRLTSCGLAGKNVKTLLAAAGCVQMGKKNAPAGRGGEALWEGQVSGDVHAAHLAGGHAQQRLV